MNAKKYTTWFTIAYHEKRLFRIGDSNLQLLLPPKLRKITRRHKVMCVCEICIQSETYQDFLNNWRKRKLIHIANET